MKFKPYEEYKKVDLPWIDKIPSHWEMNKIKYKFDLVKEPSTNKDPIVLSLTQKGIKIRDIELNEGQLAKSYEGYNTVEKGYICLNPMDLESGAASKSEYYGVISNAYFTIRPKGFDINSDFYSKYFNLHYKKKIFYGFGKGVGRPEGSGGRWTLNRETFTNFPILSPPKEEQDKIADFLDHNLSKIDKFIELTERQIELLKEQKEVIVNYAVTKGINKNVEYKDSGIDWIGDIPEHWEVTRLKYVLNNKTEKDRVLKDNQVYIGLANIESKTGSIINANNDIKIESDSPKFKEGDILFGKLRPYLSKVAIAPNNGLCSGEILVLRNKNSIVFKKYIFYRLLSYDFINIVNASTYGSKMPRAEWSFISSLKINVPPKKEQEEIVAYIEKETSKIDRTIEFYKRQIELIKEYRTSLIASAVTGKIDVRDF